jgi:hypothetical protein
MSRLLPSLSSLALIAGLIFSGLVGLPAAQGDVGGVYSNVPVFLPDQVVTITVTAEDDDGTLLIESSLATSELNVVNCTGLGADQEAGECDGSGTASVSDQGSDLIRIDTNTLDEDDESELLTVTLTLIATCNKLTAVTISGDQPGNFGPDDVTINCQPATPTPTQTPTPNPSATPTPTETPPPPTPTFTPQPPAAPVSTPFSQVQTQSVTQPVISPPSTGSAGLR